MGEDMGKEMEELDYVILGDAPEIVLKGEALPNPEKFVEKSLLELGRAMARNTIGEVPAMTPGDFKSNQTIAKALANVEIDDPYFNNLDPITDEGITDIAALTIAKAEAAKENTKDPENKAKLTNFEHRIAEKPPKKISAKTKFTRAAVASFTTFLTAVACGLSPATPSVTPEVTPQSPTTTEVAPPPTTESTTEPTSIPTPDVFKSLEGATATPSANGKSWNIKLENGNSFEVADPERDIKIDEFGVWKIFGKDGLLIYVFDPGVKHYDGTYTEGKGWIDARTLSPVDSSTFPKAYSEIVSDPSSSTEIEQNDYQKFLDAVTFKFANEQGIQDIVDLLKSSDKIDQELLSLWVRMYMQNNPDSLKNPELIRGKDFVAGPEEIRAAMILADQQVFNTWNETIIENGKTWIITYGWYPPSPVNPNYKNLKIFGVDTPLEYTEGDGIRGVLGGISAIDNNMNNKIEWIIMKNQQGKFVLSPRFLSFDPNFTLPQGTVCRDKTSAWYILPEDVLFGPLSNMQNKPVTMEELYKSLGKPVGVDESSAPFYNWLSKHGGNDKFRGFTTACSISGIFITGGINYINPYYTPQVPWNK